MTNRPELQKDANGLWPGQRTPSDIPDFLDRRVLWLIGEPTAETWPDPRLFNPANSLQATTPSWAPPWAAKT